jgi:HNH endonuclease
MLELLKALLLENRIITQDGCWYWTKAKTNHGYGHFVILGRHVTVHRVAASLWLGLDIRSELVVLHECDLPTCFNPEHLRVGTYQDNTADMIRKERDGIRGSRNGNALLSAEDVREIRRLSSEGVSNIELAARFGMSRTGIYGVVTRRSWKHID